MNRAVKATAKRFLDATIVPLVAYVSRELGPRPSVASHNVVDETMRRAVAESADYADSKMREALSFYYVEPLRRHAFAARSIEGLVVEFGVWTGASITVLASSTSQLVYGFDSFEGLREDWKGSKFPKGTFNLGGVPPQVPANVKLIKGQFDETLPRFLREHPEPFSFIHIDCDTYDATSIILKTAGDRFRKGTVVVFDEYFGYRGWRLGEFRAWQEFVTEREISYQYLAFSTDAVSLVVT